MFRLITNSLVRILAHIEVDNLDKLHTTAGATVVVCNHLGRLDAALTLGLVNRDDLIVVVAEKYRKYGFVRWVVKALDLLFLERFEGDLGTLKEVLRRLGRGGILIIAPEGDA